MTPQSLPKHLLNRLANCRLAGILLLGLLLAQPLLTQAPTIRYVRDGASGDLQAMVSVSAANA